MLKRKVIGIVASLLTVFAPADAKVISSHYIHHSLAYQNKAYGFYSNHHLAGSKWENNTSWKNRSNYIEVTEDMFVSTEPSQLFIKHLSDGRLPQTDFLRGKKGSILEGRKMGWAW